jgi:hypothetical protein
VHVADAQIHAVCFGKCRGYGGLRPSRTFRMGSSDPRTNCELSSIIFEHGSMWFEFRSISVDYVTIAKPSGLGMVSSFKASAARMIFGTFPPNDARRIRRLRPKCGKVMMAAWRLLHHYVQPECHEELHNVLSWFPCLCVPSAGCRDTSCCILISNSLSVGLC